MDSSEILMVNGWWNGGYHTINYNSWLKKSCAQTLHFMHDLSSRIRPNNSSVAHINAKLAVNSRHQSAHHLGHKHSIYTTYTQICYFKYVHIVIRGERRCVWACAWEWVALAPAFAVKQTIYKQSIKFVAVRRGIFSFSQGDLDLSLDDQHFGFWFDLGHVDRRNVEHFLMTWFQISALIAQLPTANQAPCLFLPYSLWPLRQDFCPAKTGLLIIINL